MTENNYQLINRSFKKNDFKKSNKKCMKSENLFLHRQV